MKIIITEEQKKKLFIPRKLSGEGSRWEQWNKEQPVVDGVQVNQYDNDGVKQGIWVTYYDKYYYDGTLESKGNYINGSREGKWVFYTTGGDLDYECNYKNNKLNGLWVAYYQNGNFYNRGNYKNGDKDGVWEWYRKNDGELSLRELYKDGDLIKKLPLTESKKDNLNEGQVYSYKLNSSHSDPNKREIIYNFTNKDNYEFEVVFYNLGNNKWEREYRTTKKGLGVLNTNDVYNIMETVTNITIDFIEMYEPNKIIITHIPKNKEVDFNNPNKPNKRALLNKRYLKPAVDKLDDYFYSLKGSTSIIEKI
jgi:hypothetical protein